MKVLFGSVLYTQALKYYKAFSSSLLNQTFKDFDVVMLNDNVPESYLSTLEKSDWKIVKGVSNSIIGLRIELLKYALDHGYDLIILGDSDDWFHEERIRTIVDYSSDEFGFYYHDLLQENGSLYFNHKLPDELNNIDPILQCNFLGLTNTAINLNHVRDFIEDIELKDVIAFDWYLYSYFLLNGIRGQYIPNAYTYYRCYEDNYGYDKNKEMNKTVLLEEFQVKRKHYNALSSEGRMFADYLSSLNDFDKVLNTDKDMAFYFEKHKSDIYINYWWNLIEIRS